jgi:predicted lipoprotein with Yx(FWY)xxD motif
MIRSVRYRMFALLAGGALLTFGVGVACGDDDDDGEAPTTAATPAAASPTTNPAGGISPAATSSATEEASDTPAAEASPPGETPSGGGATVEAGAAGLVDDRGFSLYLFANDTAGSGTSACAGGCAGAWPPLTVDGTPTAGEGVTGELGTITRDDGSTQVTYNGLPLYFFANDAAPGETNGASIPNWSLAQP